MRSLLSLLLLVPTVAAAEPWEDGVGLRAPRTAAASIEEGLSLGGDTRWAFTDVRAGGALWTSGTHATGFGATVHLGGTTTMVPSEDRSHFGLRTGEAGLWFWIGGERPGTTHAFGLIYGGPVLGRASSTYFLNPIDAGPHLSLAYDGEVDGEAVDWAFTTRLGVGGPTFVEASQTLTAHVRLTDDLALSLGGLTGLMPDAFLTAGLRARPGKHVELGLMGAVPIALWDDGEPFSVLPQATLKVF